MRFPRLRLRLRRGRGRAGTRPSPDRLMVPEGLWLTLPVARLGARLGAMLTDLLLTFGAAIGLLLLLALLEVMPDYNLLGIGSLLFFLIRVPYCAASELAWNGQTLGKRLMKIKVVAHGGGTLTPHALLLRNLMKEAEVFFPLGLVLGGGSGGGFATLITLGWCLATLAVPLCNRHRQRLGDLLAGTHVIVLPQPVLLPDMAAAPGDLSREVISVAPKEALVFLPHQLDHYGALELQTLETLLRVREEVLGPEAFQRNRQIQGEVIEKIRRKIGHAAPVVPEDRRAFLQAFYTAQRAHLERRQLFGDRRADKHHASPPAPPGGAGG